MDRLPPDFSQPERQFARYGGPRRSPARELPLMLLAMALGWAATFLDAQWPRFIGVLVLMALWFYLPYYLVKLVLRWQLGRHLEEARRLGVTMHAHVNPRAWAALYIVLLFGSFWLAVGVHRLFQP